MEGGKRKLPGWKEGEGNKQDERREKEIGRMEGERRK